MSHTESSQPVSDSRRFSVLRRLILVLILLFAVITAINWTVWLILNPKPPVFTVNSLSMSNSSTRSNSKQILNLQLSINNPNKKITLFLDDFHVFVNYKDTVVLKGTSMNLKQTVCLEKMSEQSLSVFGDMVGSSEWSRRSMVNVKMTFTIRFRAANLLTRAKQMEVSCMNLGFEFKGRGKDCSLRFV